MLVLRSVAYNALFYLNLILHILIAIPTFLLPRRAFMAIAKSWGRTSNALLAVAGISVELRGREKIPPGALLVASKHQSFWEAFTLLTLFDDPAFIVKRELMWIPFFGWLLWKADQVPVDRRAKGGAIAGMMERARAALARGVRSSSFPKARAPRPAHHPPTGAAWPVSTRQQVCRACRSRSMRVCSGRAASFCAIPERSSSKCSTRSRPDSTGKPSRRASRPPSRPRPRG